MEVGHAREFQPRAEHEQRFALFLQAAKPQGKDPQDDLTLEVVAQMRQGETVCPPPADPMAGRTRGPVCRTLAQISGQGAKLPLAQLVGLPQQQSGQQLPPILLKTLRTE